MGLSSLEGCKPTVSLSLLSIHNYKALHKDNMAKTECFLMSTQPIGKGILNSEVCFARVIRSTKNNGLRTTYVIDWLGQIPCPEYAIPLGTWITAAKVIEEQYILLAQSWTDADSGDDKMERFKEHRCQ